jgi:hypothetical protein
MRAVLVIAAALATLPVAPAIASAPRDGGRYEQTLRGDGIRLRVVLTLANDGREFAWPSFVEVRSAHQCVDGWGFAPTFGSWRARPVVDGRFRSGPVRGRFTSRGRLAIGVVAARAGCTPRRLRFAAPLVGMPKAPVAGRPSRCDDVTVPTGWGHSYGLEERGMGCTPARALVRAFHAEVACDAVEATGGACRLGAMSCGPVHGGAWLPLAGIRCARAGRRAATVEILHRRPCPDPEVDAQADVMAWAINLDCGVTRTFPYLDLLDGGTCRDFWGKRKRVSCRPVAGFACHVEWFPTVGNGNVVGSCRSLADRALGFRFRYHTWL